MPIDLSTPEVGGAWGAAMRRTVRSLEAKTGLKGAPKKARKFLQVRRGGSAIAALHGAEIGCDEWMDDEPLTLGRSFMGRMARRAGNVTKTVASTVVNPVAVTKNVAHVALNTGRAVGKVGMDLSRGQVTKAFVDAGSAAWKTTTALPVAAAAAVGYGREAANLQSEYDLGKLSNELVLRLTKKIMKSTVETIVSAKKLTLGGAEDAGSSSLDFLNRHRDAIINLASIGVGAKVAAAVSAAPPVAAAAGAAATGASKAVGAEVVEELRYQYAKNEREKARAAEAAKVAAAEAAKKVAESIEKSKVAAQKAAVAGHLAAGRAQAEYIKHAGSDAAASAAAGAAAAGAARAKYEAELAKQKGSKLGKPVMIAGAAVVALLVLKR